MVPQHNRRHTGTTDEQTKDHTEPKTGPKHGHEPHHGTGRVLYYLDPHEFDAWREGRLSDRDVDLIVARRAKRAQGGRR